MEFLDENSRPRFVFQSHSAPQPPPSSTPQTPHLTKPLLILSISFSTLLFSLTIFLSPSEPLHSLLLWLSLSLLLGPFAPSSLTGGSISVGQGPLLSFPHHLQPQQQQQPKTNPVRGRLNRPRKPEEDSASGSFVSDPVCKELDKSEDKSVGFESKVEEVEREWSEEDLEALKRQMVKHPVGMPGRWEAVAEAFKGRHKVESVIKMGKSMGERRLGSGEDSFSRFLKDRKPLDRRIEGVNGGGDDGGLGWSAGEDIALLNALKAFPKDVSMRWEKIAAAVPGKSKNACMKRVAELKRDFRSSKAATEG